MSDPMYAPPSFANTKDSEKEALKNEHRRMLQSIRSAHRILGDMLDEQKRAGPAHRPLSEVRKKGFAATDVGGEKDLLDLQGMQSEEAK